jgi:hypothetical protein
MTYSTSDRQSSDFQGGKALQKMQNDERKNFEKLY